MKVTTFFVLSFNIAINILFIFAILFIESNDLDGGENEDCGINMYFRWANNINDDVQKIIEKEVGDEPNAYIFLPLVKKTS